MRTVLAFGRLVLPAAFVWACSAADPVGVGSDPQVFPESELDPDGQPVGTLESGGSALGVVEPYMGGATRRCEASFQPCGGSLNGTSWIIEDTCTSLSPGRSAQREARELLELDPDACRNIVRSLTSKWSGALSFVGNVATDSRLRQRRFDIALGQDCLSATFGGDASKAGLAAFCGSMGDSSTTCVPSADGCRCTLDTLLEIDNHGTFGVVNGWQASITGTWYDYCVQGNRLYWGDPGTNTYIVMRPRDGSYVPPSPDAPDDPY